MGTDRFTLEGKVAVVTGAGRGLGAAMATGFAAAGAKVVCAARTISEIEETAVAIRDAGGDAIAHACDATRRADCDGLIAASVDHFGRVDVMLANHGIGRADVAEDITGDDWRQMMDINLDGCFNCAQTAGRQMISQGSGGSIILISSNASLVAYRGLTSYSVSKAGVDHLCRQLALEWGHHHIRVNTINPGYMTHHMRGAEDRHSDPALEDRIKKITPLPRRGAPEELVGPAIFLASDASSFVTGHIMPVDGGYTIL